MEPNSKIYIAGHTGMMGSAFLRQLQARGQRNILTRTRQELDLTNQSAVNAFFEKEKPQYVLVAAAKVGGIMANATYPADFIYLEPGHSNQYFTCGLPLRGETIIISRKRVYLS